MRGGCVKMEYGSREFLDIQAQFEKDAKKLFLRVRFEKENRGACPNNCFYAHGETNDLFRAYMLGYSLGLACAGERS